MAQYCRYCSGLYCPHYDLNPIDAFGENEKGYQPRHKKEDIQQQCEGQMDLSQFIG